MKQYIQSLLNKEGYVVATLIVSGLMAAAGLAGNAPFIRIAIVIALYNALAAYWFNKLCESTGAVYPATAGGTDENPS